MVSEGADAPKTERQPANQREIQDNFRMRWVVEVQEIRACFIHRGPYDKVGIRDSKGLQPRFECLGGNILEGECPIGVIPCDPAIDDSDSKRIRSNQPNSVKLIGSALHRDALFARQVLGAYKNRIDACFTT